MAATLQLLTDMSPLASLKARRLRKPKVTAENSIILNGVVYRVYNRQSLEVDAKAGALVRFIGFEDYLHQDGTTTAFWIFEISESASFAAFRVAVKV